MWLNVDIEEANGSSPQCSTLTLGSIHCNLQTTVRMYYTRDQFKLFCLWCTL